MVRGLKIPIEIEEESVPYKAPVPTPVMVPPKHEHYGGDVRIPSVDVIDEGEWYKVIADLPGVSEDKIKIHLSRKSIEICSELEITREEKGLKYVCRERCHSNLCRYFAFPYEVLPSGAKAFLRNGVLEVKVQKVKSGEAKKKKGKG